MSKQLKVESETGRLRRVIVHTPGKEVEAMSPSMAEESLYNDIIPLNVVKEEHKQLKGFLQKVAEVHELTDIFTEALATDTARNEIITTLCSHYHTEHRMDDLRSLSAACLAATITEGLPAKHIRLDDHIRGELFDVPPLANMYFMRDAAMVYRNTSIAGSMRFPVRRPEALIHKFIFSHHPDFKGSGCLIDGPAMAREGFSLEGGDFQVVNKRIVLIGVSERSSPAGVDFAAHTIADSFAEPLTVFAVLLPIARATIHLDMVFTVVDKDACLVFEPVILGSRRSRVIRIDAAPHREHKFTEVDSLLSGLKGAGVSLEPILTGGSDSVAQEREQWLSGSNSFSFAPGKIISYSCNNYTLEALSKAGFEIRAAKDFIDASQDPMSFKRLAVGFDGVELARGGGGARCMTCPVERDE